MTLIVNQETLVYIYICIYISCIICSFKWWGLQWLFSFSFELIRPWFEWRRPYHMSRPWSLQLSHIQYFFKFQFNCRSWISISSVKLSHLETLFSLRQRQVPSIYRDVCNIADFAIYREKSRNLMFFAKNHEILNLPHNIAKY